MGIFQPAMLDFQSASCFAQHRFNFHHRKVDEQRTRSQGQQGSTNDSGYEEIETSLPFQLTMKDMSEDVDLGP